MSHHVSSTNYPIAQPLATILNAAIPAQTQQKSSSNGEGGATINNYTTVDHAFEVERENLSDALQLFVKNCFVAIDNVFFSTPSSLRERKSFQHRLLIRISTDERNGTLTITDLGSGMTRSDIINTLGAGSRLSSKALNTARVMDGLKYNNNNTESITEEGVGEENDNGGGSQTMNASSDSDEDSEDDDDSIDSSSSSSTSSTAVIDEDEDTAANEIASMDINQNGENDDDEDMEKTTTVNTTTAKKSLVVPAKAKDIGSFYAAICAIGEEVEIGTKSKFDDYYIFKLPAETNNEDNNPDEETTTEIVNAFSHFSISRPMDEGIEPKIENGFDTFTDIRGDSGTRVTIKLNKAAINAGFLKQEEVLKPLFEKEFLASSYTVVLDECCTPEQRLEIIHANEKEQEDFKEVNEKESSGTKDTSEFDVDEDLESTMLATNNNDNNKGCSHNTVKERAKFIPIRLTLAERKMLRLVEAAMSCCEYTTDVDKPFKNSARRTHAQLKHITSVLRGMVTACDYKSGQHLLEEDNYSDYETFICQMFEIARRHKIMNPEKMRTEYGKLIYLLQDAVSPSIQPHLSFSCKGKIETVYKFLEERKGLGLLDDPLIEIATREVLAEKKTRQQISLEIRRKERAVAHLKQTYRNPRLSAEDVHQCLYSICDNDSFLNSNRVPIDKIIHYLKKFFSPGNYEEGYSLSIVSGQDGSRLSHSHERQFNFALQSLTLWRDIIDDMFRLWAMAEEDLLSESITYSLQDTGQGMQRVQQSPLTYKSMQKILSRVQGKVNQWVGSNVIHLGDHNVPNALMFIDKYTQVPKILSPIVNCLENLERVCEEDDGILKYVETEFGCVEQLKKDILYDFFKSAFDGSGADNFYDAGSCIDGRLTSAWNWCSQLQEKPFYCIFKLIGFTGFDGEFK